MAAINWSVLLTNKARKSANELPVKVKLQLGFLIQELEKTGPHLPNWSHYRPLKKMPGIPEDSFHCHIKSGRPTYVVCWQLKNKKIKIIEIFYVGTHEKAPY